MTSTKYKIGITVFILFIMCSVLQAQINISVDSGVDKTKNRKNGVITIKVEDISAEYTYFLLTDFPLKGGKVIKSVGPIQESTCKFNKLKNGFYVVAVQDDKSEARYKGIVVKNN